MMAFYILVGIIVYILFILALYKIFYLVAGILDKLIEKIL